ncbi:zinc finger, CCHC-type containing protein [Tanacetum coccineum]
MALCKFSSKRVRRCGALAEEDALSSHHVESCIRVKYPMPEFVEDETLEQTRKRCKWENDDYICRGHILNGISDVLFDVYQNVGSAKELWDQLESKYMTKDVSSKKFLKDFKHTLKHNKDELSLVQLGSHFRIEETLRAEESGKGKGREIAGSSSVSMIEDGKNKNNNKNNKAKKRKNDENKKYVVTFIDDASRFCYVYLCHAKDEALDKFKIYKTEVELQQNDLIKTLRTDKGGEYYDPVYYQSIGIIHETTAHYTPQQNGVPERKNIALKEMVNLMLSYSGLSEEFWGEAMAVVRLPKPKRKNLGEKCIDCIFIGYAEHSKAYRFYVIEPNEYISINSVIESKDAMFDEKRFTSIPRPKSLMLSSNEDQIGETPVETPTVRRSNRARVAKSFGSDFRLYLVEGSRDEIGPQYSYCYSIEEDPRTFDEAMQSRDVAFWKEAINDEMDSIMENNTWILSDLPPGCKPLGCKWIFKRKMKVDGTIDKFKARLVIQGFRQKEGIDYFDTYAPDARISIIRLLIALAAIYNLVIHQMNVKTTFLNGDLEEDTDQDQVDKTKEFLSSKFSMKDMGKADVILGIKIKREDKGRAVDQLEYSRAIGCLLYAMTSTRPNVAYVVGKLKDHTSTTGWVFLLGGCTISWASKKQTSITDSTMEVEFVALAAAGKEAEWLRNLIYEILLWPKLISSISIHCDSAATLAKAYS